MSRPRLHLRRRSPARRLLIAAAAVWLGRWALLELASYAGRHWLPPGPPATDSLRQPGRLPGPFGR